MAGSKQYDHIFKALGTLYRRLRWRKHMVQEDVMEYGFSVRHYQQLEAGRPHSLKTLFRLADMFGEDPAKLLRGLLPKQKRIPDKKKSGSGHFYYK